LTSGMSQDPALQQGVSQLQTSEVLWMFAINIISPLNIDFPFLNPSELHHYHVTCIILLPSIKILV
jgi:hypothetical protein